MKRTTMASLVLLAWILLSAAVILEDRRHGADCVSGAHRGPYAGRLFKADEDQLIEDCKNGRRFQ